MDRAGFQSMLAALSTQTIDAVVVLNTSRLWRSDIVKVLVHREFKKHGVDVRSIEQPTYSIYKKDPNDFLINGLMELLDQYQRLEIALKLGRGRYKKAEQGGYAGGRATFGYKAKKGQKCIQVDEKQAITVRRVFQLKEQYPSWTLTQIAENLNQEGFTTQQGRLFTKVQIKRILDKRDFYSGTYRYGNIEADGLHEAIL
ncbi:resolvase [Paenibacillus curdlanolyticus]|nr:resolvase [Paenibacillus curdlanolyticus]